MNANLEELESLLAEISELGAAADDKGVNKIPSFDPILAKARCFGVDVPAPVPTLDDLRTAVENACEVLKTAPGDAGSAAHPMAATKILGNQAGMPGDGP